ncbi:MAG: Crp/Fnr family transcriptional regulator [Agathobacter sp.]|nr:Crp/Fnr family transcriptional regulator [Agathobacter sp.]
MSHQFEIATLIVEETCPHRKLQLENIRLFANIIQCKKYHKGDIILGEGEVCNNLLYIEQGLLRQYYVKHGKDVTEHLSYEGNGVVWCIESYFHQTPTHLLMEALEPSVVWEIPRDLMEDISDKNCDIAYLYRRFFEDSLILSQVKADMLRFESAKERYSRLMQLFPEIVKRAPLTYIASYLQMSLETLSRVRSSMT